MTEHERVARIVVESRASESIDDLIETINEETTLVAERTSPIRIDCYEGGDD